MPQILDGLLCVRVDSVKCKVLNLHMQLVDTLSRIEHFPCISLELVEHSAHLLLEFFFLVALSSEVT